MQQFFRFLFSKTFVLNVIIALGLISAILYGAMSYLESYTMLGKTMEVPNVTDVLIDSLDNFEDSSFTLVVSDSIYLLGKPAGYVVEQNPKANTTVKSGRKIYLTVVTSNPPKVTMPNLVDLSLRQATSLMETYGLVVGELTYKPDLCTNCILEQKINEETIEAGVRVKKGIKIDLIIGQGLSDELVAVPFIIELSASMANELLKSKSLNIGSYNYDETVENAEDSLNAFVYKQYPEYSEEPSANMGSSVDVYLTLDTNRLVNSVNP